MTTVLRKFIEHGKGRMGKVRAHLRAAYALTLRAEGARSIAEL